MATVQINFRIAEEAAGILGMVKYQERRETGDLIRLALMEFVERHYPDLADEFVAHTLAGGSVEKYDEALEAYRKGRQDKEQ